MDIQEKKAFEIAFENKLGAHCCQFDLDEDGNYEDRDTLCGWHMWLEAKANAVPDEPTEAMVSAGCSAISYGRTNEENVKRIFKAMIEAQEPANADTNS